MIHATTVTSPASVDGLRLTSDVGDLFGKPYTFAAKLTPRSPERAEFMKKTFAGATTNVLSLKDASDNGKLGDISHLCEMLEADAESTAH